MTDSIRPHLNNTYIGIDKVGTIQLRCASLQDVPNLEEMMTLNEIHNGFHLLNQNGITNVEAGFIRTRIKDIINGYVISKDSGFMIVALNQKNLMGYSIHTTKTGINGPNGSFSQVFVISACVNQGLEVAMMQKAFEVSLHFSK